MMQHAYKLSFLLIIQFHFFQGFAQQRASINGPIQKAVFYSTPISGTPFLSVAAIWTGPATPIQFIIYNENLEAMDTISLTPNEHVLSENGQVYSNQILISRTFDFFKILTDQQEVNRLHFYDPGASAINVNQASIVDWRQENDCEAPTIVGRSAWCPNNQCPEDQTPQATSPTHAIIHHSAGSNNITDWAAAVRTIWDLHVNMNGWDDIGYNWLIDPDGHIYAGRAEGLQGAHFCSKNKGTIGICILGTFTNVAPTEAAINSLKALLAWQLFQNDIPPLEEPYHASSATNLRSISGHRDGCSTVCPGDQLYVQLDDIAIDVAGIIDLNCQMATNTEAIPLKNLSLSPNPADQWINITFSHPNTYQQIDYQIINSSGICLYRNRQKHNPSKNLSIKIDHLPAGSYYVVIQQDNYLNAMPFIKQ